METGQCRGLQSEGNRAKCGEFLGGKSACAGRGGHLLAQNGLFYQNGLELAANCRGAGAVLVGREGKINNTVEKEQQSVFSGDLAVY